MLRVFCYILNLFRTLLKALKEASGKAMSKFPCIRAMISLIQFATRLRKKNLMSDKQHKDHAFCSSDLPLSVPSQSTYSANASEPGPEHSPPGSTSHAPMSSNVAGVEEAFRINRDHGTVTPGRPSTPAASRVNLTEGVSLTATTPEVNSESTDNTGKNTTLKDTKGLELKTIKPSEMKRYDRNIRVPSKSPKWLIDPLTSKERFIRKGPPNDWTSCIHPEGILYHRGEVEGIVFYTDADVCDSEMSKNVESVTQKLKKIVEENRKIIDDMTPEIVVVLEYINEGVWGYYLVDHATQHLYWLAKHYIETNIYHGAESEVHIGQLIRSEYYLHLSYYPHGRRLDDAFFKEMRGIFVWGLTDSLTSIDSLTPYTEATMSRFLKLIKHIQVLNDEAPEFGVAAGARLRMVFENSRFDNFSGLPCARLSRCQSVRGEGRQAPSPLFYCTSLLFFQVPVKYLRKLDGIYMDNVVFQTPFRLFVKKSLSVWQQDVINAAVLFTANIAFLAIPSLLPDSEELNAIAVASVVSITLSLSSVIFGQLLSKKLESLEEEQTTTIASYFAEWWSTKSGLSELAVMYSLPYALMIWGVIAFILAVFLFAYRRVKVNAQMIVITVFLGGAVLLCLWIVLELSGWSRISYYPSLLLQRWQGEKKPDNEDSDDNHSEGSTNVIRRVPLSLRRVVLRAIAFFSFYHHHRRRQQAIGGESEMQTPNSTDGAQEPNIDLEVGSQLHASITAVIDGAQTV